MIQYDTRIDNGYGGASSSSISLVSAGGLDSVSLSIYHNDSTYGPNYYLLSQVVNGNYTHFQQLPLNQIIEYDKWYRVNLFFNSTNILFYLDGNLVGTWMRPSDSTYESLKLGAESADASFRHLKIEERGKAYDIFDTQNKFSLGSTIPARLGVEQDTTGGNIIHLLSAVSDALLVTSHQEDANFLNIYGISTKLLNKIYYPDGTVAFLIFELDRVPTLNLPSNIIAKATSLKWGCSTIYSHC